MTSIEDIKDVEGFSGAVVRRLFGRAVPEHEVEEAIAEGVAILFELRRHWDPVRCVSFYSYCTTYLQLRLIDWWRKESRQRNLAHRNGNGYVYHHRVSLDELGGENLMDADDEDRGKTDSHLVVADSHRIGD